MTNPTTLWGDTPYSVKIRDLFSLSEWAKSVDLEITNLNYPVLGFLLESEKEGRFIVKIIVKDEALSGIKIINGGKISGNLAYLSWAVISLSNAIECEPETANVIFINATKGSINHEIRDLVVENIKYLKRQDRRQETSTNL